MKPTDYHTGAFPNWCPGCVLPETLIRTNPSVKPIAQLQKGDRVLGYDGEYHGIREVMRHRHKGTLYTIHTACFGSTTLTGEHPVLAVRRAHWNLHSRDFASEWVEAEKLRKGDYVVYPVNTAEKNASLLELPVKRSAKGMRSEGLPGSVDLTDGLLRLFGYYVAEGYVRGQGIYFTFSEKEQQMAVETLTAMWSHFRLTGGRERRARQHQMTVFFYSLPLRRVFAEWFGKGAASKKLPHMVMQLPKKKQAALLQGMWRGNGWVHKDGLRANYTTVSTVLCEQVKTLLLRQGIVPVVSESKERGMHKKAYRIQIVNASSMRKLCRLLGLPEPLLRKKLKTPSGVLRDGYLYLPVAGVQTMDYDGMVYNLEVDNANSYVSETAALHNCGDFGIWGALKGALVKLNLSGDQMLAVYGIGCHGHMVNFLKVNGFEGLHGRPIPVAEGAKLANHQLPVLVVSGDGDTYGEGMGHFIAAARGNHHITLLVHNNQVYGLTIGQTSPTSAKGFKTKSTPEGAIPEPVNPIALAITAGATFVARGFAGDIPFTTELIAQAMQHRGFALVDIFQPCVTFNSLNTFQWFRERIYKLEGHDSSDKEAALKKAWEKEKLPIGVFYREDKPTYEDEVSTIKKQPLVKQQLGVDRKKLLEEFY